LLQEASDIRAMADFPWLLSAAGAIVLVVLAVNLLLEHQRRPMALPAVREARVARP
jgi:ABC-type dipeptide/oligopeptide/nickel transport system permease subunit